MFCRDTEVKKMEVDLNRSVDGLYRGQHQQVSPEAMKLIGTALLRAEQGQIPDQISTEVGIEPERVRELVIRCRGWEFSCSRNNNVR